VGDNVPMDARSGTSGSADAAPRRPLRRILVLVLSVVLALVAWGLLVHAAIDFGREARSGEATAWVFLALATIAGAACLLVTLLLGARALTLLRGGEAPARPRGGHRAAR
jgi:fatty acid desaturase